jgi:MFS family permease
VALFLIGPVAQTKTDRIAGVSWRSIQEGINFIVNKPIILSTMLLDFVATFFASANTLMPIIARDILHVGVVQYGWLSAAQSVGAVLAALVVSQLPEIRRQGQIFLGSVIVFGVATVVFGVSTSLVLAWFALAVTGAADSVSTIIRNTIRQLQTPDHIRGRMTSVNQIFFQGGPQLGEVEAGVVAQLFGAPFAIISGGIGCIVGMWLIIRKWPLLLSYNGDEHIPAGVPAD